MPWRSPSEAEWKSIVASTPPADTGQSIYILRTSLSLSGITGFDPETVPSALREICTLGDPVHIVGTTVNRGNLKTATISNERDVLIGMHVDSWDLLEPEYRQLARNRVSVNIGVSARHFMFLPLPVDGIAAAMADEPGPEEDVLDVTSLGRRFMRRFPDIPIVRCTIMPGEAYVAPTENLVHDGSTEGNPVESRHFTLVGHIMPTGHP